MKRCHPRAGIDDRTRRDRRSPQERSKMACDECRKRKLRCDERRPCETCRTRELPCTISSTRKGPGRPRNQGAHVSAATTPSSHLPEIWTEPVATVLRQTVPSTSNPPRTVFREAAVSNSEPHLSETIDLSSPASTAASRFQEQTQPMEPTFPLSAFEGTFPSIFGLPNGEQDTTEWNDGDIDLLSGLWDPPISVYLHSWWTIYLTDSDLGSGTVVLRHRPRWHRLSRPNRRVVERFPDRELPELDSRSFPATVTNL